MKIVVYGKANHGETNRLREMFERTYHERILQVFLNADDMTETGRAYIQKQIIKAAGIQGSYYPSVVVEDNSGRTWFRNASIDTMFERVTTHIEKLNGNERAAR